MEAALKAETTGSVACGLSRALLHLYRGELAECLKLAKPLEEEMSRQSHTVNNLLTLVQLLLAQCCFARRAY
jgi:tetratricopeptide (TPR) repeat protein